MTKLIPFLALAAAIGCSTLAHADDASNKNGSQQNPKSSAAATPEGDKHSPGTVGAMKGAEGGSFTASESDRKKDSLKSK